MLDQETLYQLLYRQQWKEILHELYKNRKDISSDSILTHAAKIFEQTFFSKLKDNLKDRNFIEHLDTLYILHKKDFYTLTDENFRLLILAMVKWKPLMEAANYAKEFPDDPICKEVSNRASIESNKNEIQTNKVPMNWIEIFNRLFELINDQSDTATYFSGPKFINIVREAEPYFPDYGQYIDQRNRDGKSTSRKIFFYDILIGLNEASRSKVLARILELLHPFKKSQVEHIEVLLGKRKPERGQPERKMQISATRNSEIPKVFISYSWDGESHKQWVLSLADRLRTNGVDVILDRYYLSAGKSITHFVEQSLKTAQKVIIIFTPNYKLKADHRAGGVGYEYSIMNNHLYNNQTDNDKIIPILRTGNMTDSIPDFMQQYIHLDLRNDETFETSYIDLLREIFNEPAIKIPEIGKKPSF